MPQTTLKPTLLDLINDAHEAQQTLLTSLSEDERAAIGTPEHWSARDMLAHLTFWKQRELLILTAVEHNQAPPRFPNFDELNAQVFEEQCQRTWHNILQESERAYEELLAHIQRFTEDDLASARWFPPEDDDDGVFPAGRPLWDVILGNGYWHPLSHYTQFYLDRHDIAAATRQQESLVNKLAQRAVLPIIHGIVLYNLACLYATTGQQEKAPPVLREALQLNPDLTPWSKQDPDLASLREEQV